MKSDVGFPENKRTAHLCRQSVMQHSVFMRCEKKKSPSCATWTTRLCIKVHLEVMSNELSKNNHFVLSNGPTRWLHFNQIYRQMCSSWQSERSTITVRDPLCHFISHLSGRFVQGHWCVLHIVWNDCLKRCHTFISVALFTSWKWNGKKKHILRIEWRCVSLPNLRKGLWRGFSTLSLTDISKSGCWIEGHSPYQVPV